MSKTGERPHLVLICIDALRADCLTGSGIWSDIGRPETPHLDAFGRSARVYSDAIASSSWTKPSVPSLLTSMHPSEHGVLEVAKGTGRTVRTVGLPAGVPTLSEILQRVGYRTIGLAHNAQLDESLGFSRGFDVFTSNAGPGDEILGRLEELDPFRGGNPVFLYLHYIEPHWPYRGNVTSRAEAHATGRYAFHRFKAAQWKELKRSLRAGETKLRPEEARFLRWVYRLAAEEADRVVGRCIEWLDRQGALDRSVALLTSDHGEELFDHGLIGHGQSLYEELVRVPLFLRIGGRVAEKVGAEQVGDLVSHVDVLPTLVDAAGLEIEHPVAGSSLLNGAVSGRKYVFSEVKHKRRYHQSIRGSRWKLVRRARFSRDPAANGTGDDYNNLDVLFAERPYRLDHQLFDLSADPTETDNRFSAEPEIAASLTAALDDWWSGLAPRGAAAQDLEEQMIRRLEALGYL
jgi:arylsulfatase A-like enzyme